MVPSWNGKKCQNPPTTEESPDSEVSEKAKQNAKSQYKPIKRLQHDSLTQSADEPNPEQGFSDHDEIESVAISSRCTSVHADSENQVGDEDEASAKRDDSEVWVRKISCTLQTDISMEHQLIPILETFIPKKRQVDDLLTIFSECLTVKFIHSNGHVEVVTGRWCNECRSIEV